MSVGSGRDRDPYTWRPGRGFAGGAVTGLWFSMLLAVVTVAVDGVASGWRLGLLAVVVGELVGTLIVAVPVLTLVGAVLRSSSRLTAIGAYAAAAVVARVLVGPLVESAVGSSVGSLPAASWARVAVVAAVSLVVGAVAASISTRDRLPRTTGLLRFRVGGPSTGGGVPGPSAAPAPASRYGGP